MKKYKLTNEGKEILKEILLNLLVGPMAMICFIATVLFGLLLYCMVIWREGSQGLFFFREIYIWYYRRDPHILNKHGGYKNEKQ